MAMYFLQIIATFMDFHFSAVSLLVVKKYFLTHCTTVAMGILCPNIDTLFLYCLEICRSITSFHPFLCNVSEPCSFKIKRWCMWIVNNKIRYDDINWLIRSSVPALNSADYMLYFWKDVNLIILSLNFAKTLEWYWCILMLVHGLFTCIAKRCSMYLSKHLFAWYC